MKKTSQHFNWEDGFYKRKRLTHSFDSLEKALQFIANKKEADVYKSKGKYVAEWIKTIKED